MDKIHKALIELLASTINNNTLSLPELSNSEWHSLLNEAKEHGVHLLILDALNKQKVEFGDKLLRKSWKELLLITTLYHASSIAIVPQVLDKMALNNISVMILKGYYLKTLYPKPELRVMSDVDLFVRQIDFEAACAVLNDLGYSIIEENHSTLHKVFIHPSYITIELHHSILIDSFNESQKTFERLIWDESKVRYINEHPCIVPSDVNNAIYCCMHMLNHLHSSGFGLRQLCDLIILLRHNNLFDWNEFFQKARMFNVYNFVTSVIWICQNYLKLNLPPDCISVIHTVDSKKAESLLAHILNVGEFGTRDTEYLISKTMAEYQFNAKHSNLNNTLLYLFPSRHLLDPKYGYAKNCLLLLPIAWLHRILFNMFRTDLSLNEKLPKNRIMREYKELVLWINKE